MSSVSFVIPVLNNKQRLESCLSSIRAQKTTLPIEIIVVDNGSTDGSAETASAVADRLIIETSARSPYVCRNKGISVAKGDVVVLMDSNVVLGQIDWVERALLEREKTGYHIGVPRFEFDFQRQATPTLAEYYSSVRYADSERDVAQRGASGGCLVCVRSIFESVGLFPVQRSNSDTMWTRRATDLGAMIVYLPSVVSRYPAKNEMQQKRTEMRIGYGNRLRWRAEGASFAWIAMRGIWNMRPDGASELQELVRRRSAGLPDGIRFASLRLFAWKMKIYRGLGRLGVTKFGSVSAD